MLWCHAATPTGRRLLVQERRQRLTIPSLLAVLVVAQADCGSPLCAAQQRPPNIVLVMADDQGYGDVGYNGHPTLQTPVLDEMAARGLRFDRFYAAHPVCSPTRGSVMTGRNPNRFACFSWGHTLRPEEITVAEALRSAGYATGHFGKWHLGSCRAEDPVSPGGSGFDEWASSPNFYENSPLLSRNGEVIETRGESSEVTVRAALSFVEQIKDTGRPFLAVIWFGNPHTPHEGVEELKSLYPDASEKEQNYYAEITGIDRAMGLLRRELRAMDVADNTLLWYTSDNGQQGRSPGSSGGLRDAKGSLWEGGIRVPTIIEWPAMIPQPRTTSLPALTSDIYPTLLDIAGVSMDNQPPLDGVSLKPLIAGEMTERPPIGFWVFQARGIPARSGELLAALRQEQQGEAPVTGPPERTAASRMEVTYSPQERPGHATLIDGDWKLHRLPVKNQEQFRYELYHLADDRAETTNLARQHADRAAKMREQLDAWQGSVIESLNGADY